MSYSVDPAYAQEEETGRMGEPTATIWLPVCKGWGSPGTPWLCAAVTLLSVLTKTWQTLSSHGTKCQCVRRTALIQGQLCAVSPSGLSSIC